MNKEVRDATKKERQVCARAPSASPRGERAGERPVSSFVRADKSVSRQCPKLSRLCTGARSTPCRMRHSTSVDAREMVSGPCAVSVQCLRE
jgi:hypothetical protein